jgi:hypothetical protein
MLHSRSLPFADVTVVSIGVRAGRSLARHHITVNDKSAAINSRPAKRLNETFAESLAALCETLWPKAFLHRLRHPSAAPSPHSPWQVQYLPTAAVVQPLAELDLFAFSSIGF